MSSSHDPGAPLAKQRADRLLAHPDKSAALPSHNVRIGTASWTDPTLTTHGVFYPEAAKSAETRLNFYSSVFPLVEVDSIYYALPSRNVAELWVQRTPVDFRFNVKAYALMTGHPSEVSRFPRALKDQLPAALRDARRVYSKDLPEEIVSAIWNHFIDAIEPLSDAGKLGAVLLQYPPWFLANRKSVAELTRARKRLGTVPASVEFRSARWLAPAVADRTFAALRENEFSYVCVDEPQGMASSVPPILAVTNDRLAIVRMHGRRTETWEQPGAPVSERFRYLYQKEELEEWVPRVTYLADQAAETHVVFNNCYANYGTTNALEIGELVSRVYKKRGRVPRVPDP